MHQIESTTESKILEAARQVFMRKGMSGARMQDIADQAGINKALLHYYYRNKQKLFEVVFREAVQNIFIRIKDIIDSETPVIEKLTSIAQRYITELSRSPYLPLFVFNEIYQHPQMITSLFIESEIHHSLKKLFQEIQTEVDKGYFRKIAPPHLLINIISLCIFPFVASPLLQTVFELDAQQLQSFMKERKKQVPLFIRNAVLNF
ncbi:TetR/AcrR family transcriptional regulator [Arachidicoccus terrestris]|uniref:TetR/AcrR family transcriptional regulator n=1 Tax=Arachidicoccus terrestris TaxID=2875539 RepID=UPI001CC442A0|nr:TetR/AcrR family transcriptional regulator [Arachidicoccus terrestris]UAY54766.1 TetR/AcrR family transcriptional regulator [Arachidicoccus terrestris]